MIKAYAFFLTTFMAGSATAFAADGGHHGLKGALESTAHDFEHGLEAAAQEIVHDAHHAESAGLPQLDPTFYASQLFWLLVMFVFMYTFFARSILPTLSSILDNRHKHIQDDLDMAQSLKTEAEDVQASYEMKLGEARDKAATLYGEIESDIAQKSEERLKEFQDKFSKEVSVTEAKLAKAKKEAMAEMNDIAAEIASIAATKIVGVKTDPAKAQDIVKDLSKAKAA